MATSLEIRLLFVLLLVGVPTNGLRQCPNPVVPPLGSFIEDWVGVEDNPLILTLELCRCTVEGAENTTELTARLVQLRNLAGDDIQNNLFLRTLKPLYDNWNCEISIVYSNNKVELQALRLDAKTSINIWKDMKSMESVAWTCNDDPQQEHQKQLQDLLTKLNNINEDDELEPSITTGGYTYDRGDWDSHLRSG